MQSRSEDIQKTPPNIPTQKRVLEVDAPTLNALEKTACEGAKAAGDVLAFHFGKTLEIREKQGAGLVTNADIEAEATAIGILKRDFPEFDFLAEESANKDKKTKKPGRWIIDPLDGTTNFVHGFPMFCVSIGLELHGELILGAIYHPILKELYFGSKGRGAFLNGQKMEVSKTQKLSDALLTTGFNYAKKTLLHDEMLGFERLSLVAQAVRRPGSAALDLAYTARGVFDGFWERSLSPWDVAAGVVLVREAGGIVSNFSGKPYDLKDANILASNPALHPAILQSIAPENCPLPS